MGPVSCAEARGPLQGWALSRDCRADGSRDGKCSGYSHLLPSPLPFLGKEELAGSGRDVSETRSPRALCSFLRALLLPSRLFLGSQGALQALDLPYMRWLEITHERER